MKNFSINYHDSYLVSISTDIRDNIIEILFTDGINNSTLRFLGVTQSELNSFTIGNIVLDIELFSGNSLTDSVINDQSFKNLLGVPKESSYYNKVVQNIREGHLIYVCINTSYGCHGAIICEQIEEIPPDKWDPWENADLLKR